MKKPYKVGTLVEGATGFDFNVRVEGTLRPIVSNSHFVQYVSDMLSDRLFLAKYDCDKSHTENIETAKNAFLSAWLNFIEDMSNNKAFAWRALHEEYNPIENYDRYEDGGYIDEHHKGTRTSTNTDLTSTPDLTTEVTARTKHKTSNYTYGFNSADASPSEYSIIEPTEGTDKTTQTGTNTTTGNASTNYTEVSDISATVFDKDIHKSDGMHVHGNIGVAKTSEIIADELKMREYNLSIRTIEEFINMYTFYCDACLGVIE